MKIVITGVGETGHYLAEILLKEGHDLVLVEKNKRVAKQAQNELDAQIVTGDGGNALTLEPLVDETTDLFVALTDRDETNIIGTLIARRFGVQRAITRVSDPTNLIHPLLTDDPQVSTLNSEMVVSRDLTHLVGNPSADEIEFFAHGKAEMVRMDVADDAKILGTPLRDVKVPDSWLVVGVVRNGKLHIASGDLALKQKDQVLAVGDPAKYREVEQLLGLHAEKVKRVILIGMNDISSKLARALKKRGIEIRLIEESNELAERAAAELNGVLIFRGDGTSDEILEQAGVEQADYLIALTEDDESNVLISLLAKEKGVKKVLALTAKPQYQRIIEKIGIDAVVNPRSAMVEEVIRCIEHGSLKGLRILEQGQGRMLEFTIEHKSKVVGVPLSDIELPKQSLIGSIVRREEVIIPRGKDRIRVGDHIVVFSSEASHAQVERLFLGK
jgi:trk system potassium uptake protein